jgi:hypothetical protein
MWSPYITGSDAAIYQEMGQNIAEGNGPISSICRFTSDKATLTEYVEAHGTRLQRILRPPLYIYSLSVVYMITGLENYMLGINIFNLILFLASLIILYLHLLYKYPNQRFVHIASLLWVGMSYTVLEFTFGAWMESMTLLIFVAAYSYHCFIVESKDAPWWHGLLYGLLLSALFLTKRSAIPFVAAFLLHLFLIFRPKHFISTIIVFCMICGSWYYHQTNLSAGSILLSPSHHFPFGDVSRELSLVPRFRGVSAYSITVFKRLLEIGYDLKNLGILLPFSILYFATTRLDKIKGINWLLLLVPGAIYMFFTGSPNVRYVYPIFVALIPASLVIVHKVAMQFDQDKRIYALYFILAFAMFFHMANLVTFSKNVVVGGRDRTQIFETADRMLAEAGITSDNMVATNIIGYNVYSESGHLLLPPNTTTENKSELIDFYDVDYILFCEGAPKYFFWNDYLQTYNMYYDLDLISRSDGEHKLFLYRVDKN